MSRNRNHEYKPRLSLGCSSALIFPIALLTLLVIFLIGASTAATASVTNGKIAFYSIRDGNNEIYTMNADGTGLTRLTNNTVSDSSPEWSPDGSKIAFTSERNSNIDIYTMNADGTLQTRLTSDPSIDWTSTWSPDGSKIAFASMRTGNINVYAINAKGSGLIELTDNPAHDGVPDWSPDGTKIAFTSDRDGDYGIYTMSTDGIGLLKLTTNNNNSFADWSPDGTKIVFNSDRDGDNEIYTMNTDGSDVTKLTDNQISDYHPAWSPDGTKIAFDSDRDGDNEIYTMNTDGSDVTKLTDNPALDYWPSWQSIITSDDPSNPSNPSTEADNPFIKLIYPKVTSPRLKRVKRRTFSRYLRKGLKIKHYGMKKVVVYLYKVGRSKKNSRQSKAAEVKALRLCFKRPKKVRKKNVSCSMLTAKGYIFMNSDKQRISRYKPYKTGNRARRRLRRISTGYRRLSKGRYVFTVRAYPNTRSSVKTVRYWFRVR